ncbi:hypothetical protein C0J52_15645 [Blattella germanica]|nr:hypothetical protein C0J52_15645 [Blattella germanica]
MRRFRLGWSSSVCVVTASQYDVIYVSILMIQRPWLQIPLARHLLSAPVAFVVQPNETRNKMETSLFCSPLIHFNLSKNVRSDKLN